MSTPNQETPDLKPDDTTTTALVQQVLDEANKYSGGALQLELVRLFGDYGYKIRVSLNAL